MYASENYTIIGWDNRSSPVRPHGIILPVAGLLLTGTLGWIFHTSLIKFQNNTTNWFWKHPPQSCILSRLHCVSKSWLITNVACQFTWMRSYIHMNTICTRLLQSIGSNIHILCFISCIDGCATFHYMESFSFVGCLREFVVVSDVTTSSGSCVGCA